MTSTLCSFCDSRPTNGTQWCHQCRIDEEQGLCRLCDNPIPYGDWLAKRGFCRTCHGGERTTLDGDVYFLEPAVEVTNEHARLRMVGAADSWLGYQNAIATGHLAGPEPDSDPEPDPEPDCVPIRECLETNGFKQNEWPVTLLPTPERPSSMHDFTLSQHQWSVAALRRNGISIFESY